MNRDFIHYVINDILFVSQQHDIKVSLTDNTIILSSNGKTHKEAFFLTHDVTLGDSDYQALDNVLKNIDSPNYFPSDISILKIVFYFSNELYIKDQSVRDQHERVCLKSIKERDQKYLEYPIVNILTKILTINLKLGGKQKVRINFTCDYDILNLWSSNNLFWAVKRHIKNIISIPLSATWKEFKHHTLGTRHLKYNPLLNTEMFVLDNQLNNYSVKNLAFMIVEQGDKFYDPKNNFNEVSSKKFMKQLIDDSKVQVGLHPNYHAHYSDTLNQQSNTFEQIFNFRPKISRNHYLRGEWPTFLYKLEELGIKDDFSFGFADTLLFRGGISSPFKLWSIALSRPIDVLLHPLTIMEGTVLNYLDSNIETANMMTCSKLELAERFGSEITLLWHNRSMYKYGFENNYMPELFYTAKQKLIQLNDNYEV
jgi:hypothetical protein